MSKTKHLYVLRHGEAESYGYNKDELRALTDFGFDEVKSTAQVFQAKGEMFDAVFVSPYLRAQQTAQCFLEALGSLIKAETCPLITPSGKGEEVALWLNSQPYQSILIVTHQPFAHQFVDLLVDEPLPANFAMTTATLAAVQGELFATACCQYRWSVSPS
ncbi:phosphohistidine phosphatase SixA [Marinomonas transparens]|uniref:Phosphohistidine phosphatase SixA n=1 Tax=Marinomonas transparens TaxID=2795388 RepID=A0A934N1F8_9GAMM|nr:phosphohistidine phosphatase SixA [Marinomonas transparens]MBJ7539470.1 phosphohistidine phosphatase SixA [Marinomonas transparens]